MYTRRTGGRRFEIVAHADDAFFYPGGFTDLLFRRDRGGDVLALDMYQGGTDKSELEFTAGNDGYYLSERNWTNSKPGGLA